jgi:hypothetical protein
MDRNGSLHLLRLGPDPDTGALRYAVSYAPYDKGGGALPTRVVRSDEELVTLLASLKIDESAARESVGTVRSKGRSSLSNVIVSDEELRRHGLHEMGILESVISYLST